MALLGVRISDLLQRLGYVYNRMRFLCGNSQADLSSCFNVLGLRQHAPSMRVKTRRHYSNPLTLKE